MLFAHLQHAFPHASDRHQVPPPEGNASPPEPDHHLPKRPVVEAGFDDADELILRRVNTVDGRKTGWINDRRVSGELLDEVAGHTALLDKVRVAWGEMSKARNAVTAAETALAAAQEEEDFLRHSVAELDTLAPLAGEDASLDASRRRMQAAERIREDIVRAAQVLGVCSPCPARR